MNNNRIKGLIYGAALGDAVGAYTEFRTKVTLKNEFPTPESFTFPPKQPVSFMKRDTKCLWTDDTNQMICIINSLYRNGGKVNVEDFAHELKNWVLHGFSEIGQSSGEGCGGHTYSIVTNPFFEQRPIDISKANSRGKSSNGSIMRTAIMGARKGERWNVIQDAGIISDVTHYEDRCQMGCKAITSLIYDILHNTPDETSLFNAKAYIPEEFRNIGKLEELPLDSPQMGFSMFCVAVGLWAFRQRHRSFKDVITEICLQGGDADTNACVAGAILGCYMGFDALPEDWLATLRHKEFLEQAYEKIESINSNDV